MVVDEDEVHAILRSLAYARPVELFGIPMIPKLFEKKQEALYAVSANAHDGLALALAIHVAAALKHHLVDRDLTLWRILGGDGRSPTPPHAASSRGTDGPGRSR